MSEDLDECWKIAQIEALAHAPTLRDQFAMAALGGVVGRDWFDGSDKDTVWAAKTAYLLADAMMAERAKGRPTP